MALLHARYHEPRKSHFRLPPYLKSIPCLESQTMKLPGLFLKKASHAHPFLTSTPYPALFLPASPCLQLPSNPQPQASPRQSCISPSPTALRENEVGGGGGVSGQGPGSLTIASAGWAGKRKYGSGQARDACPFTRSAAAVSARTSGWYHLCSERGKGSLGTLNP